MPLRSTTSNFAAQTYPVPNYNSGGGSGGISSASGSFVYQPGGTAKPGVYTTWQTLYTAVNSVPGLKVVYLDPSFSSCTVPAGAWNMKGWLVYAALVLGGETQLIFEPGATLTALWSDAFYVQFTNSSNAPVMALGQGDLVFLNIGAAIASTTNAPFFTVASPNEAAFLMEVGTSLGDGNNPVLNVATGAQAVILLAGFGAEVNQNAFTGGGNVSAEVDLCAIFNTSQPGFTGNFGATSNVALEQDGNAASSNQPSQPSYSFLNEPGLGFYQIDGMMGKAGGVTVTTAGATAQTVSIGYKPNNSVTALVEGSWNVQDATNQRTYGGRSSCNIRNFISVAIAGQQQSDASGDAALNGATVSYTLQGSTLSVTFTPPGGYTGSLFWRVYLTVVENEGA